MKSGFVSIAGRPNVGKSTLLNSILDMHIAITSNVSGTTRNIIEGIYNDDDSQIVFVDTPGVHKPQNMLGSYMNEKAYSMYGDVDVILFMVDASKKLGKGDMFVLDKIKQLNKPMFLILNKVDLINNDKLLLLIDEYSKLADFDEVFPLSALKNDNVSNLIKTLKKYLKDDVKYYGDDDITNVSRNFIVAELVREKILRLTKDEVPHCVTCITESYEEEDDLVSIKVLIVIDRENIKKIIIGKNGAMLKEIGSQARVDIEKFLGKKVYLETYVKTVKDWKDSNYYLSEFGFKDLD